jgi:NADH-quinone oxidoreductase subunit H
MLLSALAIKYINIYFPNTQIIVYLFFFFFILLVLIAVLISTAYYTLLERKVLSSIQSRVGPSKVGYAGLLQPLADGLKLFLKEIIFPTKSFKKVFVFSSIFSFFVALNLWVLFNFSYSFGFSDINLIFLLIFLLSMFHVYSIIFAGWASNSKYSFLGALRSSAQLIAYDIAMVLTILNLFIFTESLTLDGFLIFQAKFGWLVFWFPLNFIVFFICVLAETNRHPFDLPEAEAELVAGYNVEYSAISFALFFLAEYSSMIFMSVLTVHIFFGGWITFNSNLAINIILYFFKIAVILYLFIFVRALIPRYRYDQLMRIGWKILIPFQIVLFLFYITINYFDFDFILNIIFEFFKNVLLFSFFVLLKLVLGLPNNNGIILFFIILPLLAYIYFFHPDSLVIEYSETSHRILVKNPWWPNFFLENYIDHIASFLYGLIYNISIFYIIFAQFTLVFLFWEFITIIFCIFYFIGYGFLFFFCTFMFGIETIIVLPVIIALFWPESNLFHTFFEFILIHFLDEIELRIFIFKVFMSSSEILSYLFADW